MSKVMARQLVENLGAMCDKVGLPRNRAIRHYAPPDVSAEFTHGMAATVSVGQGSIEGLASTANLQSSPWGMRPTSWMTRKAGRSSRSEDNTQENSRAMFGIAPTGLGRRRCNRSDEFNSQRLAR